jgi:hypothetical protein
VDLEALGNFVRRVKLIIVKNHEEVQITENP